MVRLVHPQPRRGAALAVVPQLYTTPSTLVSTEVMPSPASSSTQAFWVFPSPTSPSWPSPDSREPRRFHSVFNCVWMVANFAATRFQAETHPRNWHCGMCHGPSTAAGTCRLQSPFVVSRLCSSLEAGSFVCRKPCVRTKQQQILQN